MNNIFDIIFKLNALISYILNQMLKYFEQFILLFLSKNIKYFRKIIL